MRTAVSQFCAQVWRRVVVAAVASSRFRFWLGLSLGFWLGLSYELLFGALSLGKGVLPFVWLSSLGFASRVILCQG